MKIKTTGYPGALRSRETFDKVGGFDHLVFCSERIKNGALIFASPHVRYLLNVRVRKISASALSSVHVSQKA